MNFLLVFALLSNAEISRNLKLTSFLTCLCYVGLTKGQTISLSPELVEIMISVNKGLDTQRDNEFRNAYLGYKLRRSVTVNKETVKNHRFNEVLIFISS